MDSRDAVGDERPAGDLANLFERARLALTTRLQLDPEIVQALALPRMGADAMGTGPVGNGSVAVRLCVDERSRAVTVRVIDTRTGASVRELAPVALAALARRIGRTVSHE